MFMETHQAVYQRIKPKLAYLLQLTSLDKTQGGTIDSNMRETILQKLKGNCKIPGAVVYGLFKYRGMEMVEMYTKQTPLQVPYIVKQI